MRIAKKIKELPWPEGYSDGEQNFRVEFQWPVVDGERFMVATFTRNRNKRTWATRNPVDEFRLVCSKKQNTAAILYRDARAGQKIGLDAAMYTGFGTSVRYCYPEISPDDERKLKRWLGASETQNHFMEELNAWVTRAQESEKQAARDARGELRDEDVYLCPEELPEGLVDYIRREMLPHDKILIYKKGNVRGRCFVCGENVRAVHRRFRQHEMTRCPNCREVVEAILEDSRAFKAEYVDNIATIQKGTDGKTVFVRQWHLLRDPTAKWEDIPGQLKEVARYAVRGNRAAKWQIEGKSGYYYNTERYKFERWTRMENVTAVYDGQYFLFLPENWKEIFVDTCLEYCDLVGYLQKSKDRNTIRFLLDWARYPAVEKLWKAGYTEIVHEKVRGMIGKPRNAVRWRRETIQDAVPFPFRLLKAYQPAEWTISKLGKAKAAWELCCAGRILESEIETLIQIPCAIENIDRAFGHASVRKIGRYIEKIIQGEKEKRAREREKAKKERRTYYGDNYPFSAPQTYRDYLRECEQLELNLDDSQVLFPRDLEAAHARTMTQVKYKMDKEKELQFKKSAQRQKKLEWETDEFLIRLPKSPKELIYEGEKLHHCVGGYVDRMAQGETTILLIREKTDPKTPFYTLEWRDGRVYQCRTKHNKSYTENERLTAFVNAWIKHIKKQKKTASAA